jgi:His/Glu/Gln/Arg/opine family amino acid ABC transporter permease subunit
MNSLLRDGQDWAPQLLHGALLSVEITVITMILSVIWGLLLGIARIAKIPVLHQLLIVYVEIFRGLPTIVILFVAYFGLPTLGFTISSSAMDPGQMKAAESLGMSRLQGYCRIVLPQALLVAVPTLGSFFVGLIKDTSLLSFISVRELLEVGNEINAATFQSFQVYFYVGLIYIVLSLIASRLVLFTESRLRPMDRRRSRLDRPEKIESELPATMQVLT